jgi:hypothetical protein
MDCTAASPCRTCFHEAGHAVAAYLTGADTAEVWSRGPAGGGEHRALNWGVVSDTLIAAGWAAELLQFGYADERGCAEDFKALKLFDDPLEVHQRNAVAVLRPAFSAVVALAQALSDHQRMTGDGVAFIISATAPPSVVTRAACARRIALDCIAGRAPFSSLHQFHTPEV